MSTFLLNAVLPLEILRPPYNDTVDLASLLVYRSGVRLLCKFRHFWHGFFFFFTLDDYTRSDVFCLLAVYLFPQPDLTLIYLLWIFGKFHSSDSSSIV